MKPRFTVEHALYAGLFALALMLRFQALGQTPLSDAEAHEALAALDTLAGAKGAPAGPFSPAYASLTALAFLLFGHGTALARAVPALAGSLLALAPYLFRREVGRVEALAAGALIAVSPIFTATSRTAGGGMVAALSVALTLGFYLAYRREPRPPWQILTFAALGASLTAGPWVLTGWLTLGAALWLARFLKVPPLALEDEERAVRAVAPAPAAVVAGGLTLFGLATFASLNPAGLAAFAEQFTNWLAPAATRPAFLLPVNLALYEPLVVVFGLIGAGRAILAGDGLRVRLAWWAFIAFLFSTVFPGRSAPEALWVLLPLTALAAGELVSLLRIPDEAEDRMAFVSQMVIVLVLVAFGWLNLIGYADGDRQVLQQVGPFAVTRLHIGFGVLGLAALISVMVGLGWSQPVALHGFQASLGLVLAVYGLAAMWGLTRLRPDSPLEPWNDRPAASQVNLLAETLADISNRNLGTPTDIEVVVLGDPVSTLGWMLRDYPEATFRPDLGAGVTAPVVITPIEVQHPTLGSAYIGQAFTVRRYTSVPGAIPPDWTGWLAFRRGQVRAERVILWVRQDVHLPKTARP